MVCNDRWKSAHRPLKQDIKMKLASLAASIAALSSSASLKGCVEWNTLVDSGINTGPDLSIYTKEHSFTDVTSGAEYTVFVPPHREQCVVVVCNGSCPGEQTTFAVHELSKEELDQQGLEAFVGKDLRAEAIEDPQGELLRQSQEIIRMLKETGRIDRIERWASIITSGVAATASIGNTALLLVAGCIVYRIVPRKKEDVKTE